MITNERQYKITRNRVGRFLRVLKDFDAKGAERTGVHPRLVRAEREALEGQLASLQKELDEYEQLKSVSVSDLEARRSTTSPRGSSGRGSRPG